MNDELKTRAVIFHSAFIIHPSYFIVTFLAEAAGVEPARDVTARLFSKQFRLPISARLPVVR